MLQTTVCMMTYRTHLCKDRYRSWLTELFRTHTLKIAIAHEMGDSDDGYEHTHVVVHFGKQVKLTKTRLARGLDFEGIHPNVKCGVGKSAWNDMITYISKEDNDIGYTPEVGFDVIIDRIWDCTDERQVLKLCGQSQDVFPYLQIYKMRALAQRHLDYAEGFMNAELNEYQTEWWDLLQIQNERQILWICDWDGGLGKSWFGKWLRVNHLAQRMLLKSKAVHFMYEGAEYVYVNITRTTEDFVSYGSLEDLKDGEMVSDKYMGREMMYCPPKVIVFANFYPETSSMTMDRWMIRQYGTRNNDL